MASSITYHCEDGTMEAHRSEIYVEGALTETKPTPTHRLTPNPVNHFGASLRLACDPQRAAEAQKLATFGDALSFARSQ